MNKKYTSFIVALFTFILLGFVACSSDDEPTIDSKTEELEVESESVRVLVGETSTVDIKQGGGDYKAFSTNADIASVEVIDDKLNIDTYTNGRTTVVVSDKNSNYKSIEVVSYYGEIILEETNVFLKMRIGNNASKIISVLGGNGGYIATSEDDDIASVSSNGESLIITGKKEGKVNINVVDELDVETTFTVTIETTTNAYEEDELQVIMENSTSRFYFGQDIEYSWGSPYKSIENDYNVYGWDYYGYYYQKVYFKGNTSVGVKEDAMFSQYYSNQHNNVPISFEIIKNDGSMIWAVYSFVENGKLEYGYFVRPI